MNFNIKDEFGIDGWTALSNSDTSGASCGPDHCDDALVAEYNISYSSCIINL